MLIPVSRERVGTITTKTPQQSVASNCYIEGGGGWPLKWGGGNGSGQLLNSHPGLLTQCPGQRKGEGGGSRFFLSTDWGTSWDNFQSYAMHFRTMCFSTVFFPALFQKLSLYKLLFLYLWALHCVAVLMYHSDSSTGKNADRYFSSINYLWWMSKILASHSQTVLAPRSQSRKVIAVHISPLKWVYHFKSVHTVQLERLLCE